MENDKWQMSRAKPTRFYLPFIIFQLSLVIVQGIAGSAEIRNPEWLHMPDLLNSGF